MSNPLMGMMGGMPGGNGPFGMIQRMMGMMQNTQNPGAMLQNMAQSNPNIKKAMDMCQGRNPKVNDISLLDFLTVYGVALQMANFNSDLSQASNSDIEKHLHEQDSKYFLKIIENQNKIISMLEESISTKK